MKRTLFLSALITIALVVSLSAPNAWAVLIKGGNGTGNTSAPSASGVDMPYWDSIGQIPRPVSGTQNYSVGGTGVYLGGGSVLTAYHIREYDNPTVINFGGTEYAIDTSSWQRLSKPPGPGNDPDLAMFQISGTRPNVTPVPYDNMPNSISTGTLLYTMGFGRNRDGGQTTYYISPDGADSDSVDDLYTSSQPDTDYSIGGFDLLTSKSLRWGTNDVETTTSVGTGGSGWNATTRALEISFDALGGENEAQLTNGDSGGPAFIFDSNDNTWKLVGLNIAMGPSYSNQGMSRQPYTYPNDGGYNHGYIADLTEYQSQLVPEPATVSLLGMGGLALLIRRRRRRTV